MSGTRVAAAMLLCGTMVACAAGPSRADLDAAAAAFGSTGDVERRGGHWTGIAEPPQIFDADIELRPGSPLTSIDRSAEFPVVRDLRLDRRRWVPRSRIDLNVVDEIRAGEATWTLLGGAAPGLVRSVPGGIPAGDEPVGTLSAPQPVAIERRLAIGITDAAQLIASVSVAAILDAGSVTIVRASGGNALAPTTSPIEASRLCAVTTMFDVVAVTSSMDATGSSCEELWVLTVGSENVDRVAGGAGSGVVGIGFADGLALTVAHADCVARPCPMTAELLGPDGAQLRDLGTIELPDRDRAVVGSVAGVPIVFGGDGFSDGVMFDAAAAAWKPMRSFPLAQDSIVEPSSMLLTDRYLVMTTRNAVGLWAPEGKGASWEMPDLFAWPLYVATESSCLNLRAQPGTDADVLRCVDSGVQFWADGAHATIDDARWVSVYLPGKQIRGWVAEQYLSGVSPDDPSEYACG